MVNSWIPQYLTADVSNHGVGIRNIALNLSNDCVGIRDDGMGACSISLYLGNNGVCVRNTVKNVRNSSIYV